MSTATAVCLYSTARTIDRSLVVVLHVYFDTFEKTYSLRMKEIEIAHNRFPDISKIRCVVNTNIFIELNL